MQTLRWRIIMRASLVCPSAHLSNHLLTDCLALEGFSEALSKEILPEWNIRVTM
jgi:hypothetical protein